MTQEKLSFEEFTNLALRTESKIDRTNLNVTAFKTLLEVFVTVGTLLDYTKKGIFYNNYTKYDENFERLSKDLVEKALQFDAESLMMGRPEVDDYNFRVIHGLLGAVTESSEMAEHLLNYLNTKEVDKAGIGEEFSDSDWYKAITFDELGLDEQVCRRNVIEKLKVRFPDKYSDEAAANRDLKTERKKLETDI